MEIMLPKNLLSCHSRVAFLLGEVYNLEHPPSPFSFAKRFNVMKWLGENETSAEKYTLRGRKMYMAKQFRKLLHRKVVQTKVCRLKELRECIYSILLI